MINIAKNVFQLAGSGLTSPEDGAVYLVKGEKGFCIIDAGAGSTADEIATMAKNVGGKPLYLVATHCHIDHGGGLARLRSALGCTVVAHRLDREAIESGDETRTAACYYGLAFPPCPVDMVMTGEEMPLELGGITLHLLHTPGHTPGSICAWTDTGEERILFGQDLHGPLHPAWGSDGREWRSSLKKLLALGADILCEGHFGIFRGRDQVGQYIRSYLYR
jgi:glyoxylase-like metal-dependent hydrolase (beta-lactamase superfamily II)